MAVLESAAEVNLKDNMDGWHSLNLGAAQDLQALRKQLDAAHVDKVRAFDAAHMDYIRKLNETGPAEVALEAMSTAQGMRGLSSGDMQTLASVIAAAVVSELGKAASST